MKGVYRLAEPVIATSFRRMGEEALAGLKTTLDAGSQTC